MKTIYLINWIQILIFKKISLPLLVPVEMATLTRENNKTVIRVLPINEVERLIKSFEVEEEIKAKKEREEKEKKAQLEKEKSKSSK